MPDNYLVMFPAPKPEEIRTLLEAAPGKLEGIARHIQAREPLPPLRVGLMDKVKSGPINQGMYRYFIRTKKAPGYGGLYFPAASVSGCVLWAISA